MSVQSRFHVAPANAGVKNSIISVGEVADSDSVVVFRKTGGVIINGKSGRRITFPRQDGVYTMKAAMRPSDRQERLEVMPVTVDAPTSLGSSIDDEIREAEADEPTAVTMQAMPSCEGGHRARGDTPTLQELAQPLRARQRARATPSCGGARR